MLRRLLSGLAFPRDSSAAAKAAPPTGLVSVYARESDGALFAVLADGTEKPLTELQTVRSGAGVLEKPILFTASVTTDANGLWTLNYAAAGFTTLYGVYASAVNAQTNVYDRVWAQASTATLTQATGYALRGASVGILLGGNVVTTRVAPNTTVSVLAIGV